ncbi:D-serine deaminase, pyridoxal phosphate-dependent [Streptomyces zhaozhouensis]|uniref:D-serine deaminase, pyridoxal phosphate-dependent n=1 Tax=Streptomyces zhaozhouensis TaxID=1300267 RepID=A0A286DU24_9ACTN|nr:alanine racemase [Streptomyces zhaozhouensis]SOD62162.1 D-serine deaminase, pyridoxal phosphate-dependent [Streptomyces zhaozhouensis]
MAGPFDQLSQEIVDSRFKGLPPDAAGSTVGELAAQRRDFATGGFTTPLLTASADALDHNLRTLAAFADRHGLALAPHGKTSMAPVLFHRQLALGAWGITVAVPHQARVAREFGVDRIFLANEVVDPAALRWLAGELDADPAFRCVVYVDSPAGVALMDAALREAGAIRPVEVVVEWGVPGGRSGVRDAEGAAAVADAVAGVETLRLVGVAGYEGEVPEADAASVRAWLDGLGALAARFDAEGRFEGSAEIIVSAGGSAWFDVLAASFAELPALSRPVVRMLRAGAYVSHDHGRYREVTPFRRIPEEGALRPAFRLWAQVVSRPEAGLALLNGGKRDIAHDLGLPEVVAVRSPDGALRDGAGLTVVKLSDQHAFLQAGNGVEAPAVGEWVALGMSHPCTIFDRWPLIPVVDERGTVVELLRTFF